ncbi:MAG: adenylate/guanylate cyclase domain-containing protein [Anaerolineales bacterium]|nr:adenylate/guanylate cyclase domain-containing protein [Anaerolineales bacterium]MCX7754634.1 adenylate/guanylate cyclase domain-containing protein [Anaerolineales bacterium]MDW8278297.1 adenylate/guanylate cyclase domain-containing protein [Anaerolineales bacterium]
MDARFQELLLLYAQADTSTAQDEIEKTLWAEFGTTKAVLVMDMSGFSRLTQKYGIVHYLSMVLRMQLTSQPIIQALGGKVIKFEADNCFAMFDTVLSATEAAIRLNTAFDAINRFTEDNFDIRVSIGIDYGPVLLTGGPDFFGDVVNTASKLGEDVAGPGEILLTTRAFRQLPPEAGYTGKTLTPLLSGVRIEAYALEYTRQARRASSASDSSLAQ